MALVRSPAQPDLILVPKTDSADTLRLIDGLLTEAGKATRLVALIESARGVAMVEAIAQATPRLDALFFGAADLAADLGAEVAWEPLLRARSCVVNAAALAGIAAIDSPFFALNDEAGLRAEVAAAVRMGFTAKAAIHPRQIPAINEALTPTPEQVAEALKFFDWSFKNGDQMAIELDYVPLPTPLKDQVRATWASEIKNASGQPVYKQ